MSSARPRMWRRWLLLSIGLAVLAVVAVWWSAGFVLAHLLERQLRNGGWPEARVEHASLALPDVVFDRVQLTRDGTLVAEDVRARVGVGIDRISIGSLHAEVGIDAEGDWVLPGVGAAGSSSRSAAGGSSPAASSGASDGAPSSAANGGSRGAANGGSRGAANGGSGGAVNGGSGGAVNGRPGGGPAPLDLIPPDGIGVDRADILVSSPLGSVTVALSDLAARRVANRATLSGRYSLRFGAPDDGAAFDAAVAFDIGGRAEAELGADMSAQVRLRIEEGELTASGVEVTGLTGTASAALPADGSPAVEIDAETDATQAVGIGLGAVSIAATWRDETVRLAVTTPRPGLADVSIEGEAAVGGGQRAASLSGRVALAAGSGAQGLVMFDADLAPANDGLRGNVRLEGRDLVYPGFLAGGALDLAAEVEASRDDVQMAMSEARAELTPEAGVSSAFPEALGDGLDGGPLVVQLQPEGDRPPVLRGTFADRSAELVGRLEVRAGDTRLTTSMRMTAALNAAVASDAAAASNAPALNPAAGSRVSDKFSGAAAKAELSDLTALNLSWGDLVLGVADFDGTIERRAEEWVIEGTGAITADGDIASAHLEAATIEWAGTVTSTPQGVVLGVDDCLRLHAEAIELADLGVADLAPLCVAPAGSERTLLTYDLGAGSAEFAFSIEEQPLAFRLLTGDASYAVEGLWPRIDADGVTNEAGIARLSARLSGGAASSSDGGVAVRGIAGTAELRDGALASTALRVARIESLTTPAPIAPVGLELDAERTDDALSFDAILSDDLGTFVVEAAGRHEAGRTRADVRLHPVRFVSGATEVADLSPLLAEHVTNASGTVEIAGTVEWSGGELDGSGTVSVRELGAIVAGVRVAGLSTETKLTSVVPPVTAPAQTVAVDEIDLGMPLEDGVAVFALDAEGAIAIGRVEFAFAGGRLYAEPFTIDSGAANDIGFVLRAEAVELSHFLALSRIEGLAGTGVLSGRVPVRFANGGIRLDEGVLAAETDGVLRYTPANLPDFLRGDDVRSRMLREVLTNFQYEELSLAVSGESTEGGQQRLTLSARGANPDFLDAHPIELSFNFQGPLLGAVRSAVDLSGAAQLEQMFEQQETDNEENSR